MKLLFDQNLSPRLVRSLADLFPSSAHVSLLGLDAAIDGEVWEFAGENDFLIVTKDADFGEMALLRGAPPRVLWLRMGNCQTGDIEALLRERHSVIVQFARDADSTVLAIW